jgi:LPS-assembly lipoprotein
MTALRLTILFLFASLLSGCGFHLRGAVDLPASYQRMAIEGVSPYSELGLNLKRSLRSNGIEVVDATVADVILKLSQVNYQRRLLSVSALSGKTAEYELHYSLMMSVQDRQGKVLVSEQPLRQLRDYVFDQNNVLSTGNQEAQLRKDMERDLVGQILRRLQASARTRS